MDSARACFFEANVWRTRYFSSNGRILAQEARPEDFRWQLELEHLPGVLYPLVDLLFSFNSGSKIQHFLLENVWQSVVLIFHKEFSPPWVF